MVLPPRPVKSGNKRQRQRVSDLVGEDVVQQVQGVASSADKIDDFDEGGHVGGDHDD